MEHVAERGTLSMKLICPKTLPAFNVAQNLLLASARGTDVDLPIENHKATSTRAGLSEDDTIFR